MVYVISKQGTPLMPTERFGKVRRILKNSLAHVVRRIPFTIQLDYEEYPYYVFGRRLSGYFDIRKLDGTKVNNGSISYLYIVIKINMELKRNCNAVYLLNYHLILVVKYRQKVFTDSKIIEKLKEILRNISKDFDVEVVNQECGEDHIHILISTKPTLDLPKYINILKGHSSREIRKEFKEELSDKLWGDAFWSPSYFIASAGNISVDTIYNYINNQRAKL